MPEAVNNANHVCHYYGNGNALSDNVKLLAYVLTLHLSTVNHNKLGTKASEAKCIGVAGQLAWLCA